MYKHYPKKRYQITIDFLKQHINNEDKILDLGVENPLSIKLKKLGYEVHNTSGEDLDLDYSAVLNKKYDVVSAFQILEHLLSPYVLLKSIQANKLIASIPLKLWFTNAYRNKKDLKADGLLATCIQHEIDHLNGILFIDHISKLKRDMIIKKLKKSKKELDKVIL